MLFVSLFFFFNYFILFEYTHLTALGETYFHCLFRRSEKKKAAQRLKIKIKHNLVFWKFITLSDSNSSKWMYRKLSRVMQFVFRMFFFVFFNVRVLWNLTDLVLRISVYHRANENKSLSHVSSCANIVFDNIFIWIHFYIRIERY